MAWLEVMQVIGDTPGCRVLDISQRHSITVGGASKLIDRIEQAGWSFRTPNPDDRRSSYIELTAPGRRILKAGRRMLAAQLEADLGAAVPPEELLAFADRLATLRRAVQPVGITE